MMETATTLRSTTSSLTATTGTSAMLPSPLNSIRIGDRLELCGKFYSGGGIGIDWVHTDCGATPTPDKPDGWVRKLDANGNASDNMEANQAFCSLWPN